MSSTQYSPRVLRTFVRKPVTKLALSTFIATFVYSLTLLAQVGHDDRGAHRSAGSRRTGLSACHGLRARVRRVRPFDGALHAGELCDSGGVQRDAAGDRTPCSLPLGATARCPSRPSERHRVLVSFDRGDAVIDGVDAHHLAELARQHGCVLRLCVPVGTYMVRGADLIEVHGGTAPGTGAAPRRAGLLRGAYALPGPVLRRPAARRHRDPGRVAGDQRPDDRGPDARPAARDPAGDSRPPRPLRGLPRLVRQVSPAWWCRCPTGTGCSTSLSPRSLSTGLAIRRSHAS